MNSAINFRSVLKKEKKEIDTEIAKKCEKLDLIGELVSHLHLYNTIVKNKIKNQITAEDLFADIKLKLNGSDSILWDELAKREKTTQDSLASFEAASTFLASLIQAYDNEKVKMEIKQMFSFYALLNILYNDQKITLEELSECLGMALYNKYQLLKHHKKISDSEYEYIYLTIGAYYNENGSFKYNLDTDYYNKILNEIREISITYGTYGECENDAFLEIFNNDLEEKLTMLLENNNRRLESINKEKTKKENTNLNKYSYEMEARKYIRRYYKNGSIISIPQDIEEFYQALNKCGFDYIEKRYILKELEHCGLNIKIMSKSKEIPYLTEEEYETYILAKEALINNPYDNYLAYLLDELETYLELVKDSEDANLLEDNKKDIVKSLSLALISSNYSKRK